MLKKIKKLQISFLEVTIISCICLIISICGLECIITVGSANLGIAILEIFPFLLIIFSVTTVCDTIGNILSSRKESPYKKVPQKLLYKTYNWKDDYFVFTVIEVFSAIMTLILFITLFF